MKIFIKNDRTIRDVQNEFNKEFPYLKIEFFRTPHGNKEGSHRSQMYVTGTKLSECRKPHNEGFISISEADTVASLENNFWKDFGLSIQVFRKSDNLWIETSLTDSWTLKRQNEEGKEFSSGKFSKGEPLDLTDRDQWD